MQAKKMRLLSAVAVCFLSTMTTSTLAQSKQKPNTPKTSAADKKPAKVAKLRRLDFGVEGTKCGICLGRVRKRMKKVPGVIDTAVLIKKPFGGCALYDGSKASADEILKAGLKGEKVKIKIVNVHDRAISKMPLILVPDVNQLE